MGDLNLPSNFRGLPFPKKWEALKHVLQQLYLTDDRSLGELVNEMKARFNFDARYEPVRTFLRGSRCFHLLAHLFRSESQYKYQFKKWNWKKSVPSSKKAQIVELGQKRASIGKSTVAVYKGKQVDPRKLRRYVKGAYRKPGSLVAGPSNRLDSQEDTIGNTNTILLPHNNAMWVTVCLKIANGPTDHIGS